MKINIKYVATLNLSNIKNNSIIEVEDGTSIYDFLIRNGISKEMTKFITATVNNNKVDLDYLLKNGDNLYLYLPIGGGY